MEIEARDSGSGVKDFHEEKLAVFEGDDVLADDEDTTVTVPVTFPSDLADDQTTRGQYSLVAHVFLKPGDRALDSSPVKKLTLEDPE